MQRSYIDYAMSVIVVARAARRPRRPQAGAPPRALRDVRRRLPPRPRLLQVLAHRRRRDGSVPPARRHRDLRHPGAPRAAVGHARADDRRPGQLRLAGQRPRGRDALHRVPAGADRHGDGARHRRGHRRLPPNYDGRSQEPTVLPARFPNLLVNGSAGIAVGMATNIPPHNLREVAEGAQWALANPEAIARRAARGADGARSRAPTSRPTALIVGTQRHRADMYRTGRGSITMRAIVDIEEDTKGRTQPGHHRAALPGQPRQPGREDRRPRRHRPGPGHRRRQRRHRRRGSASGSSSCSSATRSRGSCSTTSTSTPSCRPTSAPTCWRSSTTCRAP